MKDSKKLTTRNGAPVVDNQNVMTAGPRGPQLLQDVWFLEKLAHFDREVIPERRMHAKGSGAYGTFTVTHDITKYTKAKIFSKIGKKTDCFLRFSTVAGERGAADAERDIRGFAMKFYTEEGNWDLVGNNTPVFFLRDPLEVSRPQPRRETGSPHQHAQRQEQLGLLDLTARGAAPGHHRHERPGHPCHLPSHARLRQPHLQLHQRQERAVLGQVPPQDPAGHQKPDRPGGRGDRRQGPGEPPARPVREHRKEGFPPLDLLRPDHAGEGCGETAPTTPST